MTGLADVDGFKIYIQVCVAGLPTPDHGYAPLCQRGQKSHSMQRCDVEKRVSSRH